MSTRDGVDYSIYAATGRRKMMLAWNTPIRADVSLEQYFSISNPKT